MERTRKVIDLLAPEIVWAVYVCVLATLALLEALVRPEKGVDTLLDGAVLVTAFLGSAVGWFQSARLAFTGARKGSPMNFALRIGAGWFMGPVLALCCVLGINSFFGGDIDGGWLLIYLALLAIFFPMIVLPVVMIVRIKLRMADES